MHNRVALITGASRGIGAATARLAAARGYRVIVNYVRDAASAEALVAEIGRAESAVAVQADVSIKPTSAGCSRRSIAGMGASMRS